MDDAIWRHGGLCAGRSDYRLGVRLLNETFTSATSRAALCALVSVAWIILATAQEVPRDTLRVVTWNVENLFDAIDDPHIDDATFLPLSVKDAEFRQACARIFIPTYRLQCMHVDWNTDVVEKKLHQLTSVLAQNAADVDVIALQEVENRGILHRLARLLNAGLGLRAGFGFLPIHVAGPDRRGIDVAFLVRQHALVEGEADLYLGSQSERLSRGLLSVRVRLPGGARVLLIGVHFSSAASPWSRRTLQWKAAFDLADRAQGDGESLILIGDFNTNSREYEKHIELSLATRGFVIAHDLCDGCMGTYLYRNSWSFLDMILFRPAAVCPENAVHGVTSSRVIHSKDQVNEKGGPKRFDPITGAGASDHFPLEASFQLSSCVSTENS